MPSDLDILLAAQGGVATTAQIIDTVGRAAYESMSRERQLARVWNGVYSTAEPDLAVRLAGLDLRAGEPVAVCLGTAAARWGFDTEDTRTVHVLTPAGHQLRSSDGLVVHRRDGAPLTVLDGRPATEPGWTAVEVARSLGRPRALATLDAALRSGHCGQADLLAAAIRQAGRRGIVQVRELLPLAAPQAESPMESEARLVMHDGGLPAPVLQYEIFDRTGQLWRADFAWPEHRLVVEYDGFDWHSDPEAWRRDRRKHAMLRDAGWTTLTIVADDVRRDSADMLRRIGRELTRLAA